MVRTTPDESVFDEPQFRENHFTPDASERRVADDLRGHEHDSPADQAELSVWDEPAVSKELGVSKKPADYDYETWLKQGLAATGWRKSWLVTLVAALLAGPWAILGAFLGQGTNFSPLTILTVVVIGPVIEEVMKMAVPFYIVEKRPFWFRSPFQIIICALAGGLAFAIIENLLYLNVYVPDPPKALIAWRWSVCTALHMGCSLIVGLGVMKVWQGIWGDWKRADLESAFPMMLFAVGLHGAYNFAAIMLHIAGIGF